MSSNSPKVSVVVITYLQAGIVEEAIESALSQTYTNLEVIVSDDCSPDQSFNDVISRYEGNKRVVLTKTSQNLDITGNCNHALSLVTGDYVIFMGGDDVLKADKVKVQVDYMLKHPECSVCYHPVERVNIESGKAMGLLGEKHSGKADLMLKYGVINPAVGSMYRVTDLPENGFDRRLLVASDWLFTFETLVKNNTEIHQIESPLAFYRIGTDNASSKRARLGHRDHLISRIIVQEKYPDYERLSAYSFRRYFFRKRDFFSHRTANYWIGVDQFSFKLLVSQFVDRLRKYIAP